MQSMSVGGGEAGNLPGLCSFTGNSGEVFWSRAVEHPTADKLSCKIQLLPCSPVWKNKSKTLHFSNVLGKDSLRLLAPAGGCRTSRTGGSLSRLGLCQDRLEQMIPWSLPPWCSVVLCVVARELEQKMKCQELNVMVLVLVVLVTRHTMGQEKYCMICTCQDFR